MMKLTNDGPKCRKCGDWIEIHNGKPVCKSGCPQTKVITITLTEDEADALYDVLNHASRDIEERLPDCKDDPEEMEIWGPMYDGAVRAMELIEAETTQQIIEGGAK